MVSSYVDRIDASGETLALPPTGAEGALRQGEALHRYFRPKLEGDYVEYIQRMAAEGAALMQLVDDGEVRAIGVWRTFLTTYRGRRFEIDDLVTAEGERSKGYGATLLCALEAKARSLGCEAVLLTSATWRKEAHRFYFRQRYGIDAFLFSKEMG